ncbi:MAG: MFS transporter [Bacteroidia bacterium]
MKNTRALHLLYTANAVSGLSQGISMLAIPWYFARQHSGGLFNTAYASITVVVLFWGLYAGSLIDRYSRKRVMLLLNIVCGLLIAGISYLGYTQALQAWHIIAVFAVTMLNYNVHYPALYAFAQEVSEKEEYEKVNSNIEVVGQTVSILSGGLAALLIEGMSTVASFKLGGVEFAIPIHIEAWPVQKIFAVDAATYLLAALLIAGIKYTPVIEKHIETGSMFKRIRSGFQFLRSNLNILFFGLFSYAVFAALIVEIHAVLPAYVENHLQKPGYVFAAADTIYALGAVLAGVFIARLFGQKKTYSGVVVLTLVTSAIFYWCWASREVWILYTISIVLGFTNAGIRVLRLTYLFNHVPNELIGRVNSVFNMSNVLMRALFIYVFSSAFFHTGSSITWAYFIMATFLLISGIILLINQQRRKA